jgi:uncharacterized protein YkwD
MKAAFLGIVLWLIGLGAFLLADLQSLVPHPQAAPTATSTESTSPRATLPSAQNKTVKQPEPLAATTTTVKVAPSTAAVKPPPYDLAFAEALEGAIHAKINEQRAQNDLDPLVLDTGLINVARYHSLDMAKNNYFAHEDAQGCDSGCRLDQIHYKWLWAGENIFLFKSSYRYSVEDMASIVVAGWMGSEGHRRNILDWHFKNEGIGVVILGDAVYVTEDFSLPAR